MKALKMQPDPAREKAKQERRGEERRRGMSSKPPLPARQQFAAGTASPKILQIFLISGPSPRTAEKLRLLHLQALVFGVHSYYNCG